MLPIPPPSPNNPCFSKSLLSLTNAAEKIEQTHSEDVQQSEEKRYLLAFERFLKRKSFKLENLAELLHRLIPNRQSDEVAYDLSKELTNQLCALFFTAIEDETLTAKQFADFVYSLRQFKGKTLPASELFTEIATFCRDRKEAADQDRFTDEDICKVFLGIQHFPTSQITEHIQFQTMQHKQRWQRNLKSIDNLFCLIQKQDDGEIIPLLNTMLLYMPLTESPSPISINNLLYRIRHLSEHHEIQFIEFCLLNYIFELTEIKFIARSSWLNSIMKLSKAQRSPKLMAELGQQLEEKMYTKFMQESNWQAKQEMYSELIKKSQQRNSSPRFIAEIICSLIQILNFSVYKKQKEKYIKEYSYSSWLFHYIIFYTNIILLNENLHENENLIALNEEVFNSINLKAAKTLIRPHQSLNEPIDLFELKQQIFDLSDVTAKNSEVISSSEIQIDLHGVSLALADMCLDVALRHFKTPEKTALKIIFDTDFDQPAREVTMRRIVKKCTRSLGTRFSHSKWSENAASFTIYKNPNASSSFKRSRSTEEVDNRYLKRVKKDIAGQNISHYLRELTLRASPFRVFG